jgi:uncharacterized damage-inducible protein DinB
MPARVGYPSTLASILLVLGCAAAGAAQDASALAADLERDWTAQRVRMIALAEAMPAEKWDFKATPPQRTYGEQLHHLAQAHVTMLKAADPSGAIPVPQIPATHGRAEVIKALGEAYDYGTAVLKRSAAALTQPAGAGGSTPARAVWAAMNNAMNHYGQCVVYLRLNDIVPPASRR